MKTSFRAIASVAGAVIAMSIQTGAIAPEPGRNTTPPKAGEPISGSANLAMPAKGCISNAALRLGERNPLVPPFIEVFDDFTEGMEHADFERHFEVIDANGDGRSWGLYNYSDDFYSKCAYLLYPLEEGFLAGTPGRATADDWLVSRAIKLEGGKYYNVSMDASLFLDGTEHLLEVRIGEYNDEDGMDQVVIPATTVNTKARKHINGWFQAPGDGLYYIGVHAISDRAKCAPGYLFVDNIAMDAARSGNEPGEVNNVEFTNDPNGTTMVDISFILPTTDISGSKLSGTVDVTVRRGDKTIGTFAGKRPGEKVTFKDDADDEGEATYSFVVKNSAGAGREYLTSHYAGFVEPEAPVITSVTEESTAGRVKITWTAPTKDLNGNAINQSLLRYDIYDFSTEELVCIAYDVKGTSYSVDVPLHHGGQSAALLVMTAAFNGKVSAPAGSDMLIVGTPYKFPYSYSFVESLTDESVLGADSDENVAWRMLDDFSDPKSQDGDGGYISMIGTQPGQKGRLYTGKIDLTDAKRPLVSIYTYVYPDDENEIEISVIDCQNEQKTSVGSFNLIGKRVGWNRLMLPITEFAGKTVKICFECRINSHGYIPLDNLSIYDLPETDLSVELLSASQYASADEDYEVEAKVINTGHKTISKYNVRLYCEGKCVDEVSINSPIASMKDASVLLSGRFSAVSAEMPSFHVEVETEGDQNSDNNRTAPFTITFLAPNHPTVTTLVAQETADDVTLTWQAPDLSKAAPEESFEDFESYAAFTTKLDGGWTMYDGDKGYVGGYNGVSMPVDQTQQAWWTMTSDAPYNFVPTLGKSSLVQMFTVNSGGSPIKNDDWLISPELYGGRQTVEFWARSINVDYGYDTFEVYYSLTDNSPASFRKIMYETSLEEVWEQFFVSLPDGAKYFAIRCTSENCLNMMLDNITYIAKGTPKEYKLIGYNVYRNDTKLNDEPLTGCSFKTSRELERDSYFVTAVYDRGESVASNVAYLGKSGIGEVTADETASDEQVEYFDLRGARVSESNLRPGIYLRRQGLSVSKVMIP